MASSSSRSPVPTFSGEVFAEWSIKMKDLLTAKGLWHVVEDGYDTPESVENLDIEEMIKLKESRVKDSEAFLLIHMSITPQITFRIRNAKTAKDAWNSLHEIFQMNGPSHASEELPLPMSTTRRAPRVVDDSHTRIKPPRASNEGSSAQAQRRIDPRNLEESTTDYNDNILTFNVVLTKSAVNPTYLLRFQARVASMLPSKNMTVLVRCASGERYKINLFGERKEKAFCKGWKRVVDGENLVEGNKLEFQVFRYSPNELEFKLQVLRHEEMQEESGDEGNHHVPIIVSSDSDDQFDNGEGDNEDTNQERGDGHAADYGVENGIDYDQVHVEDWNSDDDDE